MAKYKKVTDPKILEILNAPDEKQDIPKETQGFALDKYMPQSEILRDVAAFPRGAAQSLYGLGLMVGNPLINKINQQLESNIPNLPNLQIASENPQSAIESALQFGGELYAPGKLLKIAGETPLIRQLSKSLGAENLGSQFKKNYFEKLSNVKNKIKDIKTANPEEVQANFLESQELKPEATREENLENISRAIRSNLEKNKSASLKNLESIGNKKISHKNVDKEFFSQPEIKDLFSNLKDNVQRSHNYYLKNPTFENLNNYRSTILEAERDMRKPGIGDNKKYTAQDFKHMKELRKWVDNKITSSLTPKQQSSWANYLKTYRENVIPYGSSKIETFTDPKGGATASNLKSTFEYPDTDVQKVLQDLSQKDKNLIVHTLTQDKSLKQLPEFLRNLNKTKGFEKIVGKEHLKHAAKLEEHLQNKELQKNIVRALKYGGIGTLFGQGLAGGLIGYNKQNLVNILTDLFKTMPK